MIEPIAKPYDSCSIRPKLIEPIAIEPIAKPYESRTIRPKLIEPKAIEQIARPYKQGEPAGGRQVGGHHLELGSHSAFGLRV